MLILITVLRTSFASGGNQESMYPVRRVIRLTKVSVFDIHCLYLEFEES